MVCGECECNMMRWAGESSSRAPSDSKQMMRRSEVSCVLKRTCFQTTPTSHPAMFQICVTTNNGVICPCLVLFFLWWPSCGSVFFHRCVCLSNRTCKCYVMNCKYSMRLYACLVVFFFSFLININPWNTPWNMVCSGTIPVPECTMSPTGNTNFASPKQEVFLLSSVEYLSTLETLIGCFAEYYVSELIPLSWFYTVVSSSLG